MPVPSATTVAVTGLKREARIIAGPQFIVAIGGGDRSALEAQIAAALETGAGRVLSFGLCGALSPKLRVGDCVVATEIVASGQRFAADVAWTDELLARLPGAQRGILAGSEVIVADAGGKERLSRATGAAAVDMESHIAAKMAREKGVPFAAVRVVSDSLKQSLPPAAFVAMLANGKVDLGAVMWSVASRPWQIPALIRTAWEADKAFRALGRCGHVLGAPAAANVNLLAEKT